MTTDIGYTPDLSFLKLPNDKLEKASEILNSALQAHQALNSFTWYKKSAGAAADAVKKEVVALKKELTDQASKQFENLASKVEEKTGVNIRNMVPTGEGGGSGGAVGDIAGKLFSGDIKGAARTAGNLAKDEAVKRAAAVDPRLAKIADKALSGDFKGAAKSAGDIAKAKALDELRKVNPEAATFIEQALDDSVAGAVRTAALDKLKVLNPEAAKYVEQAMKGDLAGAAKSATLDQLKKANPEVAAYAEKAMNGDVQGAAKAATLDQIRKANPEAATFAENIMNGNVQDAAKDAAMEQLRKANPEAADMVDKVMNGEAEEVVKLAVLDQVRKVNPQAAKYMQQAMNGDSELRRLQNLRDSYKQDYDNAIKSLTDRQSQLENEYKTWANEYASRTGRDISLKDTKFAPEMDDVLRRTNMAKAAWTKDDQELAEKINEKKTSLTSMMPQIPAEAQTGVKNLTKLTQDPNAIKQAVVDGVKSRLSAPVSAFADNMVDMKQVLGNEGLKMFDGGDSVLRNLNTMSEKNFRDFLQTSKAAQMFDGPLVKAVTEGPGNTVNIFRKQKFDDTLGEDDFETGRRFMDSSAMVDRGESFFTRTKSALTDTINQLKSPFMTGSDSTLARALNPPVESEMKDMTGTLNDVAGVAGFVDALQSGNKQAIGMAGTGVVANTAGRVGENIGGDLGAALETGGELANSSLGVAGLAMAIKEKNKSAIAQQSTQLGLAQASDAAQTATATEDAVSNTLGTTATDTVGTQAAATDATAAENAGKSIGEKLGENLAKDAGETAILDDTGIGEVVDAGLAIGQLVTSLIDLFKGKPKAPAIYTGNQVGL